MTTDNALRPGDRFTLLGSLTLPTGGFSAQVFHRGKVVTVTDDLIERTKNRHGVSWLDDISEEAQMARWGKLLIAVGDQSGNVLWWNAEGDEASRNLARQLAREAVKADFAEKDTPGVIAALREVDKQYGRGPATSWSSPTPRGPQT